MPTAIANKWTTVDTFFGISREIEVNLAGTTHSADYRVYYAGINASSGRFKNKRTFSMFGYTKVQIKTSSTLSYVVNVV